jgi:hypothetical protein
MDFCLLELLEIRSIFTASGDFEADMPMSNLFEPTVAGGQLHPAPSLAAPPREQPQGISESSQGSQLAAFAATTSAGKLGYGALAFWIVVAVLLAARIAFLDPSKVEPTSSLFGAKATSGWTTGESPAAKN